MYVGSQKELKAFDQYLLDHGYTIEQLIDKASDCLLPHFVDYSHIAIW
jgi:NAD(P)H-hydrate epimerase